MLDGPESPRQSADIIDFNAYRNRDLIEILAGALEDARAGKLTGAIMVLQRERRNHGVVVVGSYENDHDTICALAGEIFLHFGPGQRDRPTVIG